MADTENKAMSSRVFQQFMDLFIKPEIERRQLAGELPKPLILTAAQIIFFPDGRPPQVRINREVRAIGKIRFRKGVTKNKGDPVFSDDVEGIEEIQLGDSSLADCGHATLISLADRWVIAFDFRYNKELSRQHLERAAEFLAAADFSFSKCMWSAMVDNLFSASELIARAILLGLPDKQFAEKATHNAIHRRLNRFGSIGNIDPGHVGAFNKLRKLRDGARYLKGALKIDRDDASRLLEAVKEMYEFAKGQLL